MVKPIHIFAFILIVGLIGGCNRSESNVVSSIDEAGTIQSAITVPVQYSSQIWRDVTTDKVTVTISPNEPVLIGVKAYIVHTKNGQCWFKWDGSRYQYIVNPVRQ